LIKIDIFYFSDPILATKGQSVSYLRAKNQVNGDDVLVSPRTNIDFKIMKPHADV